MSPSPALLHSAHDVSWGAWHLEPSVGFLALVAGLGYLYLGERTGSLSWKKVAYFYSGALIMLVSLTSPLDAAADQLLSMHMLQHVALATIGPPLVLLGLPAKMLAGLAGPGGFHWLAKRILHPLPAAAGLILTMWFWHAPPIYEAALTETPVHAAMHLSFAAAGLLFWWPVIQPLPAVNNLNNGGRLLYLFVTGFPMEVLALLLIASGDVVYDFYETAPRLWGLSPIEDQQIGGIVMGAVGQLAALIAITLLFFRYLDSEETRELSRGSL